MSTLNLFPTRVAIGYANAKGEVLMSREFAAALSDLFVRVGGAEALGIAELTDLVTAVEGAVTYALFDVTATPEPSALEALATAALLATPPPVAPLGDAMPGTDYGPAVAELARQVAELQHVMMADLAPVRREPSFADYVHAYTMPTVAHVDWERPGKIGAQVAATGKFSTLQSVGGFGCNTKAPQTAFALGAAAVDLPTVIILANNLRTMAINNGTGS